MGIIVATVILGTLVDILCSPEELEQDNLKATFLQAVRAFSFPANARRLSEYTCPHEPLGFTHGIIFIVFYWVSISNTFMYVNYDVTSNFLEAFKVAQAIFYEIVLNRVLPLQALFFVSGLMTTYKWLKFTPAYAFILALMIITPTWGSGPSWYSHMTPVYNNCKNHWWYNLLYINNYMDSDKVCLDHTWVLAVDAQLHLMAVFILIPLKMRPRIGLFVNLVLATASLVSVALTNVYYDLPPNEALAFLHIKDRYFYAEHSYYRVYSHVAVYCCGVFVAYFVHKHPDLKISKKWNWALWSVTLAGCSCAPVRGSRVEEGRDAQPHARRPLRHREQGGARGPAFVDCRRLHDGTCARPARRAVLEAVRLPRPPLLHRVRDARAHHQHGDELQEGALLHHGPGAVLCGVEPCIRNLDRVLYPVCVPGGSIPVSRASAQKTLQDPDRHFRIPG
ncbi:nose resistant to fluoxetine protein 6 [Caerostris extrusa]|uniref:Nose resistant to fluoxetine protein 6 n=1 Tax=Caerostris extrusa TaxID=172846 RepID=A0AAV4T605_CAEEX|nr:nose resistant to fluoxetine protein 6 [Caerostris extrusa]